MRERREALGSLLRILGVAYLVLLGVALVYLIPTLDWQKLREVRIATLPLLVAAFLGLSARYWMAFVLLLSLGKDTHGRWKPLGAVTSIFGRTWLSRYFPVKGAWVVHRLTVARKLGVSPSQMAVATGFESFTQVFVLSMCATGVLLIRPGSAESPETALWVAILGTLAFLIAGSPPFLGLMIRVTGRLGLAAAREIRTPSYRQFGLVSAAHVATVILVGTSAAMVVVGFVGPISLAQTATVVGVVALASALSMLAVFAPAGIGVREVILIYGLQGITSFEIAVVVAVVVRAMSVGLDLIFWLLSRVHRLGNLDSPVPD